MIKKIEKVSSKTCAKSIKKLKQKVAKIPKQKTVDVGYSAKKEIFFEEKPKKISQQIHIDEPVIITNDIETASVEKVMPVENLVSITNNNEEIQKEVCEPVKSKKRQLRFLRSKFFVSSVVIVAIFVGGMFYFHWFNVGLSRQEILHRENMAIVSAVEKIMVLPQGETPVLAKVIDAKKLASRQLFFAHAKNGDELLIFYKSSRAILYRPSRNIIINSGIMLLPKKTVSTNTKNNIQNKKNATSTPELVSAIISKDVSIEVLNGSNINGLGSRVSKIISTLGGDVVGVTDAKKIDYRKTIIVDSTHTDASAVVANIIAKKLNATVVQTLPDGEVHQAEDVTVILGTDSSNL